jgi:hypothetical protein
MTVTVNNVHGGDVGDVPGDALGIGFSEQDIELAALDEELALLEGRMATADASDALPDELTAAASGGADAGDPDERPPGIGVDPAALRLAEDVEELALSEPATAAATSSTGLVDQPSSAPTRKVRAAGLGGLLGALPAPLLTLLDQVALSDAAVGAISSALTLIGALAAAYLTREKAAG